MRIMNLLLLPFLILCSCTGPTYVDFFPYHDDGTLKPKVAFLPVKPLQEEERSCAEYYQSALRWLAMDSGALFLYSESEVRDASAKCKEPIKEPLCFKPADFVVQVELCENSVIPYEGGLSGCFIAIPSSYRAARVVKLRVKIVDIRGSSPRVVLYEVIERSQVIPVKDETLKNVKTVYERLAEDTLKRIEEVILCTK